MPNAPITINRLKPLQIALQLPPQIPLNQQTTRSNRLDNLVQLLSAQIFRPNIWADIRLLQYSLRRGRTNPVNVRERSLYSFVTGDVYSKQSWHNVLILFVLYLALPLLVPGVLANHPDNILALHDAAPLAKSLH
jgi:hypothetical protein